MEKPILIHGISIVSGLLIDGLMSRLIMLEIRNNLIEPEINMQLLMR